MLELELRDFLELKIAHEREVREAHQAHINMRLEGMNELRIQIEKERGTFVTREIFDTRYDLLTKRIAVLEMQLGSIAASRATISWIWGAVLAGGGLVIAFLTWYAVSHTH